MKENFRSKDTEKAESCCVVVALGGKVDQIYRVKLGLLEKIFLWAMT